MWPESSPSLGNENEVIARLLHDVREDQNAHGARAAGIEEYFGPNVLEIVVSCSGPKNENPGMADFRDRKQVVVDHLVTERNAGIIRVSLADKVHNARSTVNDLAAEGPSVWDRFNSGATDQLWWYGNLAAVFAAHAEQGRADPARAAELTRLRELMAQTG